MHFASPYYLWLLTLLVPMIGYYVWRTLQGGASIQISSVAGVVRAPRTVRYYLRHLPFALRAAAFALLVVALARPQDVEQNVRTNTEGIDIMLAIDVSGSMLARIADITGGAYVRSSKQSIGLDEIVKAINEMEQTELSTVRFEEFNEQYQYLLIAALVLLLLEFVVLDRRNPLLAHLNIFREK